MNHTISVYVTNEAGVLSRIVGLFSGRGYNIESLTVAPTLDKAFSKVTIVTFGDSASIEQITKQLNRLIPVIKVMDLAINDAIESELAIIKVHAKDEDRAQILHVTQVTDSKIIDVTDKTYVIRAVGDDKHISALVELLKPFGIKDLVRSGKVAMSKNA
ncbi:acetolactate synthase I/III small subunit [Candidatus Gastranaerophilus sp. (ex Termes propinquus)]|nr:acetolactate synthase I/III small subunit [Candidatus Gastranaerophilus sp. (ex Termes propinquus)]